ncbi:MAG: proline dehydrogenase family protein [Lewinellaceae bacterium]|nr:proline dehydrogenase family protein [Lewinellaceae bacterium]
MLQVDFSDTQIAFADKSDAELRRSHLLFSLMNYPLLVKIGTRLATLALQLRLPVEGLVKATIYRQFCGGEDIAEARNVIDKLGESGIKTILDYGVEGKESEADFDRTAAYLSRTLEYAREDEDIHIISTKLSGLFRFALLEKVSSGEPLAKSEKEEYERGKARVDSICKAAFESGIGVHVDAEHSWIQGAIDEIAWEMSRRYNKGVPTVINAVQLYRKGRLQFLKDSLQHARDNDYLCALKLVRGAYMEKERERAREMGYPSPIHDSLQETHRAYNEGLKFCIEHIGEAYVCNATHNEESCRLQAEMMEAKGLDPGHPLVATAQLYGMSDNLSYNMAKAGFNVEKYLPYGPVREVVPYLIRRTQENTSVEGQMSRELQLIRKELRRRRGE